MKHGLWNLGREAKIVPQCLDSGDPDQRGFIGSAAARISRIQRPTVGESFSASIYSARPALDREP